MSLTVANLKIYRDVLEKHVWGPVYWTLFHKQAQKGFTERWLNQFERAIPCPDCREHFAELRQRFPLYMFKDEVWAWLIHNMVNTEQSNKPFYSWASYERNRE